MREISQANNDYENVDVVIIGGNITGAASALALEKLGLSIAIVEKNPPPTQALEIQQSYALRVSAIIPVVRQLLIQLGVWKALLPERIQAVESMHVWEGDLKHGVDFNQQHMHSSYVSMAWIVENDHIQRACWQLLLTSSCQTIVGEWQKITPWVDLSLGKERAKEVHLGYELAIKEDNGDTHRTRLLRTKLIIAADGAQSSVRQWCRVPSYSKSYHQHCIVGNVGTTKPHQNKAWQRYHQGLAFAFLPLASGDCSIAWYVHENQSEGILSASVVEQKQRMFESSGGMLGDIETIQQLGAFPIVRSDSAKLYEQKVVFVGDAVRTIHPMAGQGVNLGLCDVAVLTDILHAALQHGTAINEPLVLQRYARKRSEYKLLQKGMDTIHAFFNNPVLSKVRPGLLRQCNRFSLGKQWLSEVAMGYHSDLPEQIKRL